MSERITFEVVGDSIEQEFVPSEFTDCDTQDEFEKQLIEGAEDQATWGLRLVGDTIKSLWIKVLEAKGDE